MAATTPTSIDAAVQHATLPTIDVRVRAHSLGQYRFEVAEHWMGDKLDRVVVTNTTENPVTKGNQIPIPVLDWIERTYRGGGYLTAQIYAANKQKDLASRV